MPLLRAQQRPDDLNPCGPHQDGLHQVLDLMDELALSPSPFNAVRTPADRFLPLAFTVADRPSRVPRDSQNHVHLIASTPSSDNLPLTDELLGSVRAVWADPAVQRAWSKAHEAALPSKCVLSPPSAPGAADRALWPSSRVLCSLEYLVQNASRFWAEDFVPTDADILAARATTTGILESSFKVRDMVRPPVLVRRLDPSPPARMADTISTALLRRSTRSSTLAGSAPRGRNGSTCSLSASCDPLVAQHDAGADDTFPRVSSVNAILFVVSLSGCASTRSSLPP